jgi:hypothetical protein
VKDVSQNSGSDAAWIDNIIFPLSADGDVAMFYTGTQSLDYLVSPNATVSKDIVIRNLGTADLEGLMSIPAEFVLSNMSQELPDDYYYSIAPGATAVFTMTYVAGSTVPDLNSQVQLTSNDPDMPTYSIPVTLNPVSNNDNINPLITSLTGNYPTPFNPSTSIRFSLKDAGKVRIQIYNLKGQLVKNLINSDLQSGNHQIVWDGRDDRGNGVSSGIYLYRMESGDYTRTNKMMLMK